MSNDERMWGKDVLGSQLNHQHHFYLLAYSYQWGLQEIKVLNLSGNISNFHHEYI